MSVLTVLRMTTGSMAVIACTYFTGVAGAQAGASDGSPAAPVQPVEDPATPAAPTNPAPPAAPAAPAATAPGPEAPDPQAPLAPAQAVEQPPAAGPVVETQPAPATEGNPPDAPSPDALPVPHSQTVVVAEPAAPAPQADPAPPSQPPASRPLLASQRQRSGFSARLSAGGGGAGVSRELSSGEYRMLGMAGMVGLDVGAALTEELGLYAHLGGLAVNHMSLHDSPGAGSAYLALIGPSVHYHLMPYDWYASATLDLAVMAVTNSKGDVQNSLPGFGFEVEVGRVWLAATEDSRWDVGLGLRLSYALLPVSRKLPEPDKAWTTLAVHGVFSVGYD